LTYKIPLFLNYNWGKLYQLAKSGQEKIKKHAPEIYPSARLLNFK
jgi:hypothetical protein